MKKCLSVFLIIALLLMAVAIFASADEATPEGTAIRTAASLKRMDPNGTYYLAKDIVIHGTWLYNQFKGTLDGNGHTIYLDHATMSGGLFAQLYGATVRNLNIVQLEEVAFTPINYGIGVLAAQVGGGSVTIDNVKTYANITVSTDDDVALGGLVGEARYTTSLRFNRCVFMGSLTNTLETVEKNANASMGGILGKTWATVNDISFIECVNYGSITGNVRLGGMFGYTYPKSSNGTEGLDHFTMVRCVNYGAIRSEYNSASESGAGGFIGRRIAYAGDTSKIISNINYGAVTGGVNTNIAGIAGHIQISRNTADHETMVIGGNVNYGAIKNAENQPSEKGFSIISLYRTTTEGNITENSTRTHNYHNDGLTDVALAESMTPGTNANFTGTAFTDDQTAATLAALNEKYPDLYTLGTDGKITLKWAKDAGYTADFSIHIPSPSEIEDGPGGIVAPQTLTLDVTVPEPEGTAISSQKELEEMQADGTYYLAKDIEIKGTFRSPADFAGVFHGNGHTIVINGAEVRGGIFKNLAGGKIYNLSVTEAPEAGDDNTYRGLPLNEKTICFGTIVGYGYGTIVNVTADCAVGGVLKYSDNGYVGGLIGILTDGDSIVYNCRNTGRVLGGYAGGIVGFLSGGEGKIEISRCANWGEVTSSSGVAGGIVAIHNASVIRLLVLENVNYGPISATASAYCGGIVGLQKNLWDGSAYFLRNVNYGVVTCNAVESEQPVGCPGGIIGYLNADDYEGATVSGNVNYGSVVGNKTPNQLVAVAERNEGMTVAENNFAAAGDVPATVGAINGTTVDETSFATLNTAYPDAFVAQGGQVTLKWATDAGLSATAPKVIYSLVEENENPNSGEENTTATDPITNEPKTETPPKKKKGCKSSVGIGGAVALVMVLGGAGTMTAIRRKED